MDLNKKCVFSLAGKFIIIVAVVTKLSVSELEVPPCEEAYDVVNADNFWDGIELEILARGILRGAIQILMLAKYLA